MNKKWDYDVPSVHVWREVWRVLKPGGHLLSFGGTRTYHRLASGIEDAGFEIRDQIQWIYGSGFPKSLDISKAIDKANGVKRKVVGINHIGGGGASNSKGFKEGSGGSMKQSSDGKSGLPITEPATPEAYRYKGWGTALKPANEPIVLARKPLEKGLTVAENMLKWGVGGLNIDESRIGSEQRTYSINGAIKGANFGNKANQPASEREHATVQGRWPANVLLDEEAAAMLGEPSRFFYCAKASKRERNAGLEGMPEKETHRLGSGVGRTDGKNSDNTRPAFDKNNHPTVKPIKLMEYLCRLITPPGGIILDPFMGSGSTGVAAKAAGYRFIGIELEAEYCEIAEKRIMHYGS